VHNNHKNLRIVHAPATKIPAQSLVKPDAFLDFATALPQSDNIGS